MSAVLVRFASRAELFSALNPGCERARVTVQLLTAQNMTESFSSAAALLPAPGAAGAGSMLLCAACEDSFDGAINGAVNGAGAPGPRPQLRVFATKRVPVNF